MLDKDGDRNGTGGHARRHGAAAPDGKQHKLLKKKGKTDYDR